MVLCKKEGTIVMIKARLSRHATTGIIICSIMLFAVPSLSAQKSAQLPSPKSSVRKAGSTSNQLNALIDLGDQHRDNSEYTEALSYYNQAFQIAQKEKRTDDQIYVGVAIANLLAAQGKLSEALQYYTQALSLAQKIRDQVQLAKIHNNIGNLYLRIGSFGPSLDHYQQALSIKRKLGDPIELANALINLSVFYLKTGNHERSLDYQFQALKLREQDNDPAALASIFSSISICYRHLENYPQAFAYNRKALEIQKKLNNSARIASLYNNLGVLHMATGDLSQAKQAYLKSYELKKDSSDKPSVMASLINLASLSLDLMQHQECKLWLDLASKLEPALQSYEHTRNLAKLRADYYQQIGDFRSAITHLKRYHSISDSLSSLENARQLNELEVRYEVEEKQRNIDLLTRNNELTRRELKNSTRLRNYLYIILALIVLGLLLVLWRYQSVLKLSKKLYAAQADLNALNRELEKRVETEVEARQVQEQKALRQSRLALLGELAAGISHELNQPMQTLSFTLENIKGAILDNSLDASYLERKLQVLFEDITRMQNVINHIRHFSRPQEDTEDSHFNLKQSVQNATALIADQLQKMGITLNLDLKSADLSISGNAIKFEQVILNLLTNARDAIRQRQAQDSLDKGLITIHTEIAGDQIRISISDNGCGIPEDIHERIFEIFFSTKDQSEGTGLGLAISQSTLTRMNGSISFTSTPQSGTTFVIELPYQMEGYDL
ncbi:MAG TPA: tetratricopeptide repeat protein [Candidatus Cloacimonadota bacterium]|mgnify:CR=1 FL=1|nr:tetratricopeptide repeat protein [Candidatus Cloacimonadota bacterium]